MIEAVTALRWILFGFGYPVSIAVILRWLPVVRERRLRWFAVHEVAVACVVAGWVTKKDVGGVVVNASWLAVAAAWYALGPAIRRRRVARPGATGGRREGL